MPYDDEHRMFLQGIMSWGIMDTEQVFKLFETVCKRCGISCPNEKRARNILLIEWTRQINKQLEDLNFGVVKVIDEDDRAKKTYFAFVNKADRSRDSTQLTKRAMVDYAPHELEYLKKIVAAIMETEDKELEINVAVNLVMEVKTKKNLMPREGEAVLKKFIDNNWIKSNRRGDTVSLAPRFLAEMEPYLKEAHPDEITTCKLCNKMSVKAVRCGKCSSGYHIYCLATGIPTDAVSNKCKVCKERIDFAPGPTQAKKRPAASSSRRTIESSDDE